MNIFKYRKYKKYIHEGIFESPQPIHCFINRFTEELDLITENTRASPRGQPTIPNASNQRPRAPTVGHAKIHVDAGCRKGVGGTAAAVCGDENGTF